MPIDVHAHYVPLEILEPLSARAADFGVSVVESSPGCHCLRFAHGLQVRPFFSKLVEPVPDRLASMDRTGIDRQVLSVWTDIFAYALPHAQGTRWHRLLNDSLARLCAREPSRFSWLASGALPDAAGAARELERAVREDGAVGGVVAANIEGTNLGDIDLDAYWACAQSLGVPVFIHPAAPAPNARTTRHALNQIVQYTYDTTLCVGSLIGSGVLDRFPKLELILSHGGGAMPWLIGRFDCMHGRMDRKQQQDVAAMAPSSYLTRLSYDTILHEPAALRYLIERVGADRVVLGSDDSFPPADHDPMATLRATGIGARDIELIADGNPRRLFRF
ncbi:MAG: amidohydrolase family protein [bacterium]|jgi:aminocarboxymuconate-semialdehyde decarboxylase